ncbi:hypothetical protein [Amorphus sp. 3PC139-8]
MHSKSKKSAASTADHRRVFAAFAVEMARLMAERSQFRPTHGPRIIEVGR